MNTAMSENVIAMTVKRISPVPLHRPSTAKGHPLGVLNVLDLDDGVVDHDPTADRTRHQR